MNTVEIKQDGIYLNQEKFFLISGDFHYFRTLPDGWKRRFELMKDFGLTATTTYVAWNLHEPKPGMYCFEGLADLPRYLREAQEAGLKVILRCSPYMCAEWEMGGLPSWLLKDRTLCLRSSDPAFLKPLRSYFRILAEKVRPFLFTNGGPIILVGLENEYGSFGNDKEYLRILKEIYLENGLDVPFISANSTDPFKYKNGTLPEGWNGADTGAVPAGMGELERLKKLQPDKPLLAGEAWVGGIQFWGKSFPLNRHVENNAEFLRQALKMNAVINLYMFCGGTNFGFMSGALAVDADRRYKPLMTSYDYDAPVSEDGVPRAKYFAMRDVLDQYLNKPVRPHILPQHLTQSITDIHLNECAPLLEQSDRIAETAVFSQRTLCMEDLDQDYGLIRYTTHLVDTDPRPRHLKLEGLADRATVYLNGNYIGCAMRDAENRDLVFTIPKGGAELTVLVENTGRINYGYRMYDYKGILGCIRCEIEEPDGSMLISNFTQLMGFRTETLPLKSIEKLQFGRAKPQKNTPNFLRGHFHAKPGLDTFLDMKGWGKGIAFVNGFNLGRYWSVGPQRTLYLPGELLREDNEITILEIHRPNETQTVSCIDHAILNEMMEDDYSMVGFELK